MVVIGTKRKHVEPTKWVIEKGANNFWKEKTIEENNRRVEKEREKKGTNAFPPWNLRSTVHIPLFSHKPSRPSILTPKLFTNLTPNT